MPSITTDRPLQDAVDQLSRKTPVGSVLSSREWELVPAEIRDRAMFSARVESERLLAEMQERLQVRIDLAKRDGRTMDRGVFMEEMRQELRDAGYRRPDDVRKGSLRDLKSTRRLGLIWDMNIAQAQGYAKWQADMTPEGLENEPCYELIRVMERMEHRDWPAIWRQHGGAFYDGPGSNDDYPLAEGRMIAKKTDPIWRAISRFGTPWPPFEWGSGMGLRGIDRDEADAFGITGPDERVTPVPVPFNGGHRMSVRGLPESGRESLRSAFGDAIRFDGHDVVMQRDLTPETYEQRKQTIIESIRERTRVHYLQASAELERLQRDHDGAEVGFGGEGELGIASIYLAQASAVAVGRKRLFHDTMTQAEAEAFMRATAGFPPQVAMRYQDGHFLAWRRDLDDIAPEAVIGELMDGRGGMLLGYGLDSPAFGTPHVLVRIFRQPRKDGDLPSAGFHAPVGSWRTYAAARARDLADAWGTETEVEWEVRP